MASPITPPDIESTIPTATGSVCSKLEKLFGLAQKMFTFWTYAFTNDGLLTEAFLGLFSSLKTPTGGVIFYPSASIPDGWLVCNGQTVSRTTYVTLFSLLGTAHGSGDGTTTFNLPNYKGFFLLGAGSSGGTDGTFSYTLNATGGEEDHVLTAAENGPHDHTVPLGIAAVGVSLGGSTIGQASSGPTTTSSSGNGAGHNNMPPYKAGNWIIRT